MKAGKHGRVVDPLYEAARRRQDEPALITSERTLTYRELDGFVGAAAGSLRRLGVEPGTCVAFNLPNDWRLVILVLAAIRSGVVACPLSTRLPASGVEEQIEMVRASLLVTDDDFLGEELRGTIRRVSPRVLLAQDGAAGGVPLLDLAQPATVIFTSGSSGAPKAALHRFGNHYFSALGSNRNIVLAPGDRWLLALPLYHVGGLAILFRCLLAGAAVVLPEPRTPVGEALHRYAVTHVSFVATQLRRLLQDSPPAARDRLRAVLLGGSAIPHTLLEQAVQYGLPVHTSYGLTEMASQVTTTPPGAGLRQLLTSGRVLPYREVRIAEDGEIWVRGETRFAGYLEEGRLQRPFDAKGWFATKDVGCWDETGFLRVMGRKDNMFISGGENIHPEEIEKALCRLEGVVEAVVVPVPDEEFGRRPVAFLRTTEEAETAPELRRRLETELPRFKNPVAFLPWPEEEVRSGIKVRRTMFEERAHQLLGEKNDTDDADP